MKINIGSFFEVLWSCYSGIIHKSQIGFRSEFNSDSVVLNFLSFHTRNKDLVLYQAVFRTNAGSNSNLCIWYCRINYSLVCALFWCGMIYCVFSRILWSIFSGIIHQSLFRNNNGSDFFGTIWNSKRIFGGIWFIFFKNRGIWYFPIRDRVLSVLRSKRYSERLLRSGEGRFPGKVDRMTLNYALPTCPDLMIRCTLSYRMSW